MALAIQRTPEFPRLETSAIVELHCEGRVRGAEQSHDPVRKPVAVYVGHDYVFDARAIIGAHAVPAHGGLALAAEVQPINWGVAETAAGIEIDRKPVKWGSYLSGDPVWKPVAVHVHKIR